MNRLWLRLTAFVVVGILVSTTLVLVAQFATEYRRVQTTIDPTFRAQIQTLVGDPELSAEEKRARIQPLLLDFLATDEGVGQFTSMMRGIFNSRWQGALTAVLIALPFGLLAALAIAWYIATPVGNVAAAAARVAQGDLSVRAPPPIGVFKSRELAELTGSFNAMAAALERLEHERQAMIADIAHELRTPLTIVQGQLDAMQYGVVPLDAEQLAKVSRQTELLSRLIKDLRTLSLAEAGRLSLERQPVDLGALVSDLVDGFQDWARGRRIDLVLHAPDGPTRTDIDPDRIAQVLINLIGNALRHAPDGGRVEVALTRGGDEARLSVSDSGPGISDDALERIFDRFYRAETDRGNGGGTGLGLAIAKALVELHGGALEASSQPGQGARFQVSLRLS